MPNYIKGSLPEVDPIDQGLKMMEYNRDMIDPESGFFARYGH